MERMGMELERRMAVHCRSQLAIDEDRRRGTLFIACADDVAKLSTVTTC
jgi:hypothetical protein